MTLSKFRGVRELCKWVWLISEGQKQYFKKFDNQTIKINKGIRAGSV